MKRDNKTRSSTVRSWTSTGEVNCLASSPLRIDAKSRAEQGLRQIGNCTLPVKAEGSYVAL